MVVLLLLLLAGTTAQAKVLPDLDWSSRNSFFSEFPKLSGASSTLKADLFDELTIRCPFGNASSEVSKIYMVSDMAYLNCQLDSSAELFLACDQPDRPKDRKVVFRPYSPLPNGLEFAAGKSYYLISTSNGSFSGLNNQQHGLCASASLRLRVEVLTPAAPTSAPSAEPLEAKEMPDPVIVYVSEHYNGDESEGPLEVPATTKKTDFVHSRNARLLRPATKPESLIDEASSRQLDPNLFRYVLNMAKNGAVGSVSFTNGEVKSEPNVAKEEPKQEPKKHERPPARISPKFRAPESVQRDGLLPKKAPVRLEPDYVVQDILDVPIDEEPSGSTSGTVSILLLLLPVLFLL
uniref:Ephrin RBD domain-containing protein n=1 Tax=Steinernema glaseri TaxID=37863 RepID=A0A1I7YYU9_9BILA